MGFPKCVDCGIETKRYTTMRCRDCWIKSLKLLPPKKRPPLSKEHKEKISLFRTKFPSPKKGKQYLHLRGENSKQWKGGKIKSLGYCFIRKDGSYIREHRLVLENLLGRKLSSQEIIHHINGDRADNRIDNLLLCSNSSEHKKIHWLMEKIVYALIKKGTVEYNRKVKDFKVV